MSQPIKILAKSVLWLIEALNWLLKALFFCLTWLLWPFKGLARFFYYQILLRLYRFYLFVMKRLGWSHSKLFQPIAAILVNKNLIHILVVLLGLVILIKNLSTARSASAAEEFIVKTPLAKLVADEYTNLEELIEDDQAASSQSTAGSLAYRERDLALSPQLGINTNEVIDAEDEEAGLIQEPATLTEDDLTPGSGAVATRTEIVDYTVQNGDTASSIAAKFGISVNTILWENNLSAKGLIKPGDTLRILPMTGIRHTVKRNQNLAGLADYYEVDLAKIAEANNLSTTAGLKVGQTLLIPGGRKIVVVAPVKSTPSKPAGSAPTVNTGKPSEQIVTGGKMVWPTLGHTVTQYYSWRHTALDIANKTGTPIYASGDGTVETAGWNSGGYGYHIVINHGGGKKTLYAHMSAFAVKAGDQVTKGQNIGAMGSTGRSTGPHVHFEVIINGKRANPLTYVSY